MQHRLLASACLALASLVSACGNGADATAEAAGADVAQAARRLPVRTTPTVTPTVAVSIPTGRLLASNCFQCHGTNGVSAGGFDSLAGKSVSELLEELKEMQLGGDEDEGIMRPHALGYSDAQIRSLATYFASQRKP
ncbi:MAG: hypothetical protein RIS35_3446 [Pseudomonadota bacterium]|jgi:cytochrome c553